MKILFFMDEIPPPQTRLVKTCSGKAYRVTRSFVKLPPAEQARREAEFFRLLLKTFAEDPTKKSS